MDTHPLPVPRRTAETLGRRAAALGRHANHERNYPRPAGRDAGHVQLPDHRGIPRRAVLDPGRCYRRQSRTVQPGSNCGSGTAGGRATVERAQASRGRSQRGDGADVGGRAGLCHTVEYDPGRLLRAGRCTGLDRAQPQQARTQRRPRHLGTAWHQQLEPPASGSAQRASHRASAWRFRGADRLRGAGPGIYAGSPLVVCPARAGP